MTKQKARKNEMSKTRKLCYLALGIALYVAMSASVKIPLVGHIQTDLVYIVFGAYCVLFGWQAVVVGVVGCLIESLIFSGWVPIGWMAGQIFIGLVCGLWYKYTENKVNSFKITTRIIVTVLAMFIGIGEIKTLIEVSLYSIPFGVKFAKNCIAFVADTIPMIIGMLIAEKYLVHRIFKRERI